MKYLYLLFLLMPLAHINAQNTPVNPDASKNAQRLLEFLHNISGSFILSGQHNFPHEISIYSDSVVAFTGKAAVVWGCDFSYHEEAVNNRRNIIKEAIKMHKRGHIITLMYHQVRPMDDEPNGWKESVQNEITDEQWNDLVTPGTEVHTKWLEKIDTVAFYLKQLQAKKIPVLWRPYHEMNGRWFWWGQKAAFAKLWVMMYERYVYYHKLDNLIWVWNANTPQKKKASNDMSYDRYYPGHQYVDILAADVYHNDYTQSYYDDLMALGGEKVVSIGECGTVPTPKILDAQPGWTWFMVWTKHLWTHNEREALLELYEDPRVVTLDEIKKLRRRFR